MAAAIPGLKLDLPHLPPDWDHVIVDVERHYRHSEITQAAADERAVARQRSVEAHLLPILPTR